MTSSVPLDSNYTQITALIDSSGSMAQLNTTELAQGLNQMIKDNISDGVEVRFDGAKFSNKISIFADGVDARTINITPDDISPNGMTSLVPAFARMIRHTGSSLDKMTDRRPGKVIFILLSDGEQTSDHLMNREDSDKPYEGKNGYDNLKKLVEEHTNTYNWQFFFLGTNFDSISVGESFGLNKDSCMNYHHSDGGTANALRSCSSAINRVVDGSFEGFTDKDRIDSQNPNVLPSNNKRLKRMNVDSDLN